MLLTMFLQRQVPVQGALPEELHFSIGGHIRRFGREEFMLVTGLRFGPRPHLSRILGDAFIRRLFQDSIVGIGRDQAFRLRISYVLHL